VDDCKVLPYEIIQDVDENEGLECDENERQEHNGDGDSTSATRVSLTVSLLNLFV
jgi:hypothetical protein